MAGRGFAKFFKDCADEESGHAQKLMNYQNLRGGRVVLKDIPSPSTHEWDTPSAAIDFALNLEKKVNEVKLRFLEFKEIFKSNSLIDTLLSRPY